MLSIVGEVGKIQSKSQTTIRFNFDEKNKAIIFCMNQIRRIMNLYCFSESFVNGCVDILPGLFLRKHDLNPLSLRLHYLNLIQNKFIAIEKNYDTYLCIFPILCLDVYDILSSKHEIYSSCGIKKNVADFQKKSDSMRMHTYSPVMYEGERYAVMSRLQQRKMVNRLYIRAINLQLPPIFCYLVAWHVGNAIVGNDTLLNSNAVTLLTLLDHVRSKYGRLFPAEVITGFEKNIAFRLLQEEVVREIRSRPNKELIVRRVGDCPSYFYGTVSSNRHLELKIKAEKWAP